MLGRNLALKSCLVFLIGTRVFGGTCVCLRRQKLYNNIFVNIIFLLIYFLALISASTGNQYKIHKHIKILKGMNLHHKWLWFYTVNTEKNSAVVHSINHQMYHISNLAAAEVSSFFLPLFMDFEYMCHILLRDTLHQREATSASSEVLYATFLLQNVLN